MGPPQALLAWFDRHRRELPWREDTNPYRVWVSEIMLQQTRVETVIPYYQAFLARFPTVEVLAAAELDEVLARWSGLGYYRRARQLHACAREVVARGGFPGTASGLEELPGIGGYTAAAVASIAFGEPVAVLDGNVERVITRYQAIAEEPRQRAVRARVMAAAQALLEASRPGDSNQAMMELGATVCTPTRPRCLLCPLSEGCRAREQGNPERYPALARSSKKVAVKLALAVVPRPDGKILLLRRDDSRRLLAGTWELPWVEGVADGERGRAGLERELGVRYGARWELQEELGKVRHGITFRAIEAQVWRGNVSGGDSVAEGREAGWFAPAELSRLAVSSLVAKAVRLATGPGGIAGQRDAS